MNGDVTSTGALSSFPSRREKSPQGAGPVPWCSSLHEKSLRSNRGEEVRAARGGAQARDTRAREADVLRDLAIQDGK